MSYRTHLGLDGVNELSGLDHVFDPVSKKSYFF